MEHRPGERRLGPGWWTTIFVVLLTGIVSLTAAFYSGFFVSQVPITVASDRAGLVMDPGSKVMLHGIQVGRVIGMEPAGDSVRLRLDIEQDEIDRIPANVGARIRATTAFGAKYVDLTWPEHPSAQRLSAGAVLVSSNVTAEVNTVFQSLVGVLHQIDPTKLNGVLMALSQGFRGQGARIGEAIRDADQVLAAVNPRSETVRRDWLALKGFSDVYAAAADDIATVLDAASTTSETVSSHSKALDQLLINTIGLADSGTKLLAPNQRNLIDTINLLQPTTALLHEYDPALTCTLMGAKIALDNGGYRSIGGNGRTFVIDATFLGADDPYQYPDNLPIVAAKGGPGGKPSCGSLPDPSNMYPVRQLITNTGWGTGLDIRPNPGIAHPCYADYLPVTRAVPQPASIRQCLPGPAPGPVTAPGMPPYGASLYGPGGVPLWPGIPPAGTAPPVEVPGTPVTPGKIPAGTAPAVMGAPGPPGPAPATGTPPPSDLPPSESVPAP